MHLTLVYLQDKKNRLTFIFKSCIIELQQRKGDVFLKVTIVEDPNIKETEISIVCEMRLMILFQRYLPLD